MDQVFGFHDGYGCLILENGKGGVVFVFMEWCVAASRLGNRLAAMSLETYGFQLAV